MKNIKISTPEKIIAIFIVLISTAFTLYSYYLVSGLIDVFSEMDVNIPLQTILVIDTFKYWFIFTIIGLIGIYLLIFKLNRRGWLFLFASGISVCVLLPVTTWSMYAPVL